MRRVVASSNDNCRARPANLTRIALRLLLARARRSLGSAALEGWKQRSGRTRWAILLARRRCAAAPPRIHLLRLRFLPAVDRAARGVFSRPRRGRVGRVARPEARIIGRAPHTTPITTAGLFSLSRAAPPALHLA